MTRAAVSAARWAALEGRMRAVQTAFEGRAATPGLLRDLRSEVNAAFAETFGKRARAAQRLAARRYRFTAFACGHEINLWAALGIRPERAPDAPAGRDMGALMAQVQGALMAGELRWVS